ncbi:MAG: translocation/assembly module TamB domain-containing protein [Rubrimonas sp.]|uniref:translocation/assembly module TamB domain-containing protein n=1 Tax=Rubrimonas sp. TaxID=2036015 RepID=UPI002FDCBB4C
MSARRTLAVLALAAPLAAFPPAPAPAQISLLGVQNSLIQFALARLSTPDGFSITAGRLTENEDGRTELVDVRVSDGQGAWLEIDGASLRWSARRLLLGELEINELAARGVRVLRRPVSAPAPADAPEEEEGGGFSFAWPRAPLATRVDALRLTGVQIAPGVLAAQGLAFDAEGAARDEGSEQAARLDLRRTDAVAGTIALDYLRDFSANTLRLNLTADEAAGGVVAELAGFPPDSASRLTLEADGPLSDWAMRFDAEAEQVFAARGQGAIDLGPPFALTAEIVAEPGPALPPDVAALLAPQATLVARASEGADGVIRIEEGALRAPELDLDAEGTFVRETGALDFAIRLEGRSGLAALAPGVEFARVGFEGDAEGTLVDLRATGRLSLDGLATAPADVAEARLDAVLRAAGGRFEADLDGLARGVRLDRIGPETMGETTLAVRGAFEDQVLTLDALTVASPLLRAQAEGRADLGADAASLRYDLALPNLAPVAAAYEIAADGALAAQGGAEGALSAPRLTGEARLDGLAYEGQSYGSVALRHDATLGAAPEGNLALTAEGSPYGPARIETDFRLADQLLTVSDFEAEALGVDAAGDLALQLDAMLAEGRFTATLGDAAQAAERLGVELSGAADLDVTLSVEDGAQNAAATGEARALDGFGLRLDSADIDVAARDVFGAASAQGTIAARGLSSADLAVAALRLDGEGRGFPDAPEGRLTGFAEDVAAGGARTARVDLDATLDAQALVAALKAAPVRAGDLRLGAATVDARVEAPLSDAPRIDATARVGATQAGPARIDAVRLTAKGGLDALALAASAQGALTEGVAGLKADAPLALDAAATVDARNAEAVAATIRAFDLRAGEAEARLRRPARLTLGAETALDDLDLALPGGALTGSAALGDGGMRGDLALALDDLAPLLRLAGAPEASGIVDGTARFDTRAASPGAQAALALRNLAFAGVEFDEGDLDLDARVRWNGSRLSADAELRGPFAEPLTADFATPLRPTGGLAPAQPAGAGAEGSLRWRGRIGEFWALVPTSDNVVDGDLALDLRFSGALAAPRVGGTLALRNGRYENLEIGTILTNLEADGALDESGAFEIDLRGDDAASGTVTAQASIDRGALEATIASRQAVLVRRDDATVQVTADLTANGPLAGPDIAGTVGIDRAEIRLVNANPPSVPDLGEVRIKGAPEPEPSDPAGGAIGLDIAISAPDEIFVRGRGLDSEWRADIRVAGDAAEPVVTGKVERIRGFLSLVGFPFELERGEIRFTGGTPIDPLLDIAITREANGVRGGIFVGGVASDPEITFQSTPSLPQEEVLPRVLFGRSKQSLTPTEGLQLALGVATLLDGSGGVLDSLRATAGLDVLRIEGDPESDTASVTAGQNVAPGVFVGVKQPLGAGNASVKVEIELFDNVTADSEFGQEGGPDVGINWRRDF